MTQTTHTPGPWRVVSDGISHWIEIEPNKIALIKANKADRDLIAAAPDLLAALENMTAHYRFWMSEVQGQRIDREAISIAQAAMNKARGA